MACVVPAIYAQDIILKTDGSEIRAKITEISADEVRYKIFSNPDGPVFVIAGVEVFMIKHQNGDKDLFEKDPETGKMQIQHLDGAEANNIAPENEVVEESKPENGSREEPGKVVNEPEIAVLNVESPEPAQVTGDDYAIIHLYRNSMMGMVVKYNLYLNDVLLCKVSNKWRESIKIRQYGTGMLWAKTESKTELPITIEPGREYYIRCSVKMGGLVGRPKFELVDNKTGEKEFLAISEKKGKK
jgi:hypothetical protein